MKKKGTRALLITVGGGLIVFLLVASFLAGLQRTKPVVVAVVPLPAGARLTASSVEVKQIHVSAILPNALSDAADAVGQVITVARVPGDQIAGDMLGDQATVGIAAQLEAGHRAVAIHVNQASGLLGILRPGDRVSVVAIVDPQSANTDSNVSSPDETGQDEGLYPPSPAAYITISGLRVLLVPQTFRYEEAMPEDDSSGGFSLARTTTQAAQEGVVLLDVTTASVDVAGGVEMSPAALLPLLDTYANLHLLLEPTTGDEATITVGADLGSLYRAMVGWTAPITDTATLPEATVPITDTGGQQ